MKNHLYISWPLKPRMSSGQPHLPFCLFSVKKNFASLINSFSTMSLAETNALVALKNLDQPSQVKTQIQNSLGLHQEPLLVFEYKDFESTQVRYALSKFAGVYAWYNEASALEAKTRNSQNGKTTPLSYVYVGSTNKLSVRTFHHTRVNPHSSNVHLSRALKKYGLINFKLLILNLVPLSTLPSDKKLAATIINRRETSYLQSISKDKLYNFLFIAGTCSGFKVSAEALKKRSGGFNHKAKTVILTDPLTNETFVYSTIVEACKAIGCFSTTFYRTRLKGPTALLKDKWLINVTTPVSLVKPLKKVVKTGSSLCNNSLNKKPTQSMKSVIFVKMESTGLNSNVINVKLEPTVLNFTSIKEACAFFKCGRTTFWRASKSHKNPYVFAGGWIIQSVFTQLPLPS